jgi:hypothetical protein
LEARQGVFLEGDGELADQEICARLPQALMLCLCSGLTSTEVGSTGRKIAALLFEHAGDLSFLLLQLLLPLSHFRLPLGDGVHTPFEVLLQLDISIGTGLGCSMEFFGIL